MHPYVAPVALALGMILVGIAGIVIASLLTEFSGSAGIYAGAAGVVFLAAIALVLESRAGS